MTTLRRASRPSSPLCLLPAFSPLHVCASLSTTCSRSPSFPSRLSLHRASHLPSPLDLPRPSPPERRAPRHRDTAAGRRGARLPSPVMRPLPLRHRLQAPSGHCLWHADKPPFSQAARRCYTESTYCKCMFQFRYFKGTLQVFYTNIVKVNRGCCICCNGCTHMLQASVLDVSPETHILQVCLSGCYIYFTHTPSVSDLEVVLDKVWVKN
jgi:hypothetical protein